MRTATDRRIRSLVLALALGACAAPPRPDPLAPRPVTEQGRWLVERRGEPLGQLVELRIDDPIEPATWFRAEMPGGQWLGYVDGQGRVWRRVPFALEDEFLGVLSMEKALAALYERQPPITLRAVDAAAPSPRQP
ncbi:MAG: hypothetical protein IPM29_08745 [Planctomycetes bacterium]|nr:hypothetical protein [Planctomycetota bacterium]